MGKPSKSSLSELIYRRTLAIRQHMDNFDICAINNDPKRILTLNEALTVARELAKFLQKEVDYHTAYGSGRIPQGTEAR